MTRDELLERLKGHEWNDIEFKSAQNDVSKTAYETVSAFANTSGGWLVFGVRQNNGDFEIIGVIQVDKVQNDFLSALRSPDKISYIIDVKSYLLDEQGRTVMAFFIPEAPRHVKPVFLERTPNKAYIRQGGSDMKCTADELARMIRDASDQRYDEQTVDLDVNKCFDAEALRWYRSMFNARYQEKDASISDIDFLQQWGLVTVQRDAVVPTRASILLFGTPESLLQILPRLVVDCQWINARRGDVMPDQRWEDRLTVENNLIWAWRNLSDFFARHSETPFAIQGDTLQRVDVPPDYLAFREAAINLLIHQDYSDHSGKGLIQFFRDQTVFENPGDAFVTEREMLETGDKPVRNPRIVNAFRRIGLSEAAGTGIRAIFNGWRQLQRVPPQVENDRGRKIFRLTLPKEELLTERQLLLEAGMGVRLNEMEAAVFAFATRQQRLTVLDAQYVVGRNTKSAFEVLERLIVQGLLTKVVAIPEPYYEMAPHLKDILSGAQRFLLELGLLQWRIVEVTDAPRSLTQLLTLVGLKRSAKESFVRDEIQPLLRAHILDMGLPDKPLEARGQRLVLSAIGVKLRDRRIREGLPPLPPS